MEPLTDEPDEVAEPDVDPVESTQAVEPTSGEGDSAADEPGPPVEAPTPLHSSQAR